MSRCILFALAVAVFCASSWPRPAFAQEATAENIDPIAALPPAPGEAITATLPATPEPTPGAGVVVGPEFQPTPITAPTPAAPPETAGFSREPLRQIIKRLNIALPFAKPRIIIEKSQRRLNLYAGETLVKTYRVALGNNPVGAKTTQGDGRTPEGRFYICKRNASSSSFHIFLGLSYPALRDANEAINRKQITWREYMIIRDRLASRGTPPWRTNLGGWVGIHGGTGQRIARKKIAERGHSDWTAGCIALTDTEIEEIDAATRLGAPVTIKP